MVHAYHGHTLNLCYHGHTLNVCSQDLTLYIIMLEIGLSDVLSHSSLPPSLNNLQTAIQTIVGKYIIIVAITIIHCTCILAVCWS